MSDISLENTATAELSTETAETTPQINPAKLIFFQQELLRQQNFLSGLIAGVIVAVLAGLVWAAITAMTGFQIGWMAIGIGFVVGFAVQTFGRGITPRYRFLGAGLSLFGCLAGNLMTFAMIYSREEATVGFFEVMFFFVTTPAAAIEALRLTFSPIDLLFYGLAIYQGYKLSLRTITNAEMANLTM
ncbi:MAG TPA: hypothetical protein P5121_14780 [Caldilineaceae bacterium]|nr:hypothetical protein [Caldilineaceae bacterium]